MNNFNKKPGEYKCVNNLGSDIHNLESKESEGRPPIEWYEKQLNECHKEINKLYIENQQLKELVIYQALKIKENIDTLTHLNNK